MNVLIELIQKENNLFLILGLIFQFGVIFTALFKEQIIIAIWGAKLIIKIPEKKFNENIRNDGITGKYYLIDVINKGKKTANRVQVILDKIYSKSQDDTEFKTNKQNYPMPLTWQHLFDAPAPVIITQKSITYLTKILNKVSLSIYFDPNNFDPLLSNNCNYIFQIHVESNECISKPYFLSFSLEENEVTNISLNNKINLK